VKWGGLRNENNMTWNLKEGGDSPANGGNGKGWKTGRGIPKHLGTVSFSVKGSM